MGWRYAFSSLANRDFLYLWLGVLVMMGGMQMQMLARGYLVYDLYRSPVLLGVVNAGSAVPLLGLALFGGAVADRVDRRRLIQFSQGTSIVVALFVAISITRGNITWVHLLIAATVQGASWSFLMPARQAIIPQIVGQEKLTNAMALNAAAMSATTLAAPAAAGALYASIGPAGVYYLVAALSACAVVLTGLIRRQGGGEPRRETAMVADIVAGLSYIRHSPLVLVLLLMGLATAMLAMPFRFLIPVFVVEIYSRGPEALGLLVSVMGGGSLIGAMLIAAMGKWHRGLLLICGSILSGIALLLVAIFPFYYAAAGIMILLGLGDATRRTLNQALIMEEVEDQYRGRVSSVFMMNFGLMPLGVLPAGLAIKLLGGQAAIAILGVSMLVVASVVLLTQRRLRNLQ